MRRGGSQYDPDQRHGNGQATACLAEQALHVVHQSLSHATLIEHQTHENKKEGQKLPSEREMAELFDVSRPKLREALKSLDERGLIRVSYGEGTFIAPLVGSAMSPALMSLYKRHISAFYDYLEYRREQEALPPCSQPKVPPKPTSRYFVES